MAKVKKRFSVIENTAILKREFIEGVIVNEKKTFETLKDLCKRHKLSYSTISKLATNENWKDQRAAMAQELEKLLAEKYVERQVKVASEVDDRIYALAQRGLAVIERHFDGCDEVEKESGKLMSVFRLDMLSKSAEKFQRMAKLALGQPTDNGSVSNPDGSPIRFTFDIAGGKKIDEA